MNEKCNFCFCTRIPPKLNKINYTNSRGLYVTLIMQKISNNKDIKEKMTFPLFTLCDFVQKMVILYAK